MKKSIVIIAMAVFMASAISARELTAEQAWNRVAGARQTAQKMPSVTSVTPKLVKTVNTDTGQPAYYIFNTGGCTVFASADDIAVPVLGYTESPLTDMNQIPPAMAYMLDTYVRQIEWAESQGVQTNYTSTRANDWQPIEPLVATKWDQGSPYNDLCPLKNGKPTYTGCVATAMAQAMGYYQYPSVGHGTVSYEWNQQTLSTNLSESPIRWADILPTYTKAEPGTEDQRYAIASFMRDCGYALHMEYGGDEDNGSNAQTYNIPHVLIENYDYDKGVRHERHVFYSQSDWEQLIYDELAASRPIVYSGQGDNGGHAFICDGYQGKGLFHINWGWNGNSDGYFALTALDPYTLGAGGGAGGFNFDQQAVLGIQPPKPQSVANTPYIGSETAIYGTSEGFILKIYAHADGMLPGAFRNLGSEAAKFTYGVKLEEINGNTSLYLTDEYIVDKSYGPYAGFGTIEVSVPEQIAPGEYKAYPVYKCNGGEWKNVRLPYDTREYIRISVKLNYIEVHPEDGISELAVLACNVPTILYLEKDYSFDLVLRNTSKFSQSYAYSAWLYSSEEDILSLADFGSIAGTVEPGMTETVSIKGVFDDSVLSYAISPGDYILRISSEDNIWSRNFNVKVSDNQSGIEEINTDVSLQGSGFYDLSGRQVNTTGLTPGVYIRVSGNTREKILIK